MKRLLLLTAAASLAACDRASDETPPAVVSGALDPVSIYGPFGLTGTVRIGQAACGGTNRRIQDARVRFRDVDFDTTGVFADAVFGPADVARTYSAAPLRDIQGTPITYQWRNNDFPAHTNTRLFVGGAATTTGSTVSREVRHEGLDFTAPLTGDLVQDVDLQDLASLTVELLAERSSMDDDIVSVLVSASSSASPTYGGLFVSGACFGDGRNAADNADCSPVPLGQGAVDVNGYVRTFVLSGADIVAQRIEAEVLLRPGRSYSLTARVQYRDGMTTSVSWSVPSAEVTPCRTWRLTPTEVPVLAITRPPQAIAATVFFESPEYTANPTAGGARANGYWNTFFRVNDAGDTTSDRTGFTAGGSLIFHGVAAGVTPTAPFTFTWRGVPPGRWRMDNLSSNNTNGWVDDGHVQLTWGTPGEAGYRPAYRTVLEATSSPVFRPLFRWPRVGAEPAGQTTTSGLGLDASGHFHVDDDETQSVSRHAEMAYLRGKVNLLGCDAVPANIEAGAFEIDGTGSNTGPDFTDEKGATRQAATDTYDGFARGLFRAGTHPDAGEFEVAASAGSWRTRALRLRLGGIGSNPYLGDLSVWPDDPTTYLLAPGRAQENTQLLATPLELAVTKVGVTMTVPGGVLRNPVLKIGRDFGASGPERVPYFDLGGTRLGTYVATSLDETLPTGGVQTTSAVIVALANSTIDIIPSAEASVDGGVTWNTASFTPIVGYSLSGSCGVCFVDGVPQEDDGAGPTITVTPVGVLPPETTSVIISGTAGDAAVPVVGVTVDGTAAAVVPNANSQTFSIAVDGLVPGPNTIVISARDCVGNVTTTTLTVTVAEPLCAPEETPDVCEPTLDHTGAPLPVTGSAFYVDVVGPNQELRAILCTVASFGEAPQCDTTQLYASQCGQ